MYLLDSNIFIQSSRLHYGFDFVPAFWEWLDKVHAESKVFSIKAISDEIAAGNDELKDWVKRRPHMFLPLDADCGASLTAISSWVAASDFKQAAQDQFLSVADYQLIAYAHTHDCVVVTLETSEPNRRSKIKIPEVCNAFSVRYVNLYTLLREESALFVLS